MNVLSILEKEQQFNQKDIEYLMYDTDNKEDQLTLNYIQSTLIERFGKGFMQNSKDKIEFTLKILLDDMPDKMYDFYKHTSDFYLKENKDIAPFNLIFITYINFAKKVIRSNT